MNKTAITVLFVIHFSVFSVVLSVNKVVFSPEPPAFEIWICSDRMDLYEIHKAANLPQVVGGMCTKDLLYKTGKIKD